MMRKADASTTIWRWGFFYLCSIDQMIRIYEWICPSNLPAEQSHLQHFKNENCRSWKSCSRMVSLFCMPTWACRMVFTGQRISWETSWPASFGKGKGMPEEGELVHCELSYWPLPQHTSLLWPSIWRETGCSLPQSWLDKGRPDLQGPCHETTLTDVKKKYQVITKCIDPPCNERNWLGTKKHDE